MRTFIITLATIAALALAAAPARAEHKEGLVDLDRVLSSCDAGQALYKRLETRFSVRESELSTMKEEIEAKRDKLMADSRDLTDEEIMERELSLNSKFREFQDKVKAFQRDRMQEEQEAVQPLVDEIVKAIKVYAAENGYLKISDIVNAGVIYVDDSLELTDEIIVTINERVPADFATQ
jgi:outer membrane protein